MKNKLKIILFIIIIIQLPAQVYGCVQTLYPGFWKWNNSKEIRNVLEVLKRCKYKIGDDFNEKYGNEALIVGVAFGNIRPIKFLINQGADPNYKNWMSRSALHYASAVRKNEEVIELLINNGWNINQGDDYGDTPIFTALKEKNFANFFVLMSANAATNLKNDRGATPLHYASGYHHNYEVEKEQYLLRKYTSHKIGDASGVISKLLDNNHSVNLRDKFGQTPLHYSAGDFKVFDYLLKNGADPNLQDIMGNTAFHLWYRSCEGVLATASLVEKYNFDTSIKNNDGKTYLQMGKGIFCD